jgi:signal transduction histidine kinase
MPYHKRYNAHTEVKEYLMSLIAGAPYGLLAIDLEGVITIANTLAKEYLQLDPHLDDIVDQPVLPLIEHLPPFRDALEKCLETGRKPFDLERLSCGSRYLNIRGRLILNGLLLAIEDISRQVQAEQRLKIQAEELAATNKELEEFAWLSSHDMKSPILSLEGLINMMEKNKAIKPEFSNLFEMAKSSTQQMRKTIMALNSIIAFRKTLKTERQKIKIAEIWSDTVTGIQQQVQSSGAQIDADFSGCPTIFYPPVHLKSILQNLLTNAIKYKRKGQPPVIHVRTFVEGNTPVLEFRDRGMGIDLNQYRDKLYGLFQRFHTHTEGMGIGLHMIHSIVRSYNGHILIKSKINQGTLFKIYLNDDTVEQSAADR